MRTLGHPLLTIDNEQNIQHSSWVHGSFDFRILSLPLSCWGINEQDRCYFLHFISEKTKAHLSNLSKLTQTMSSTSLCQLSFHCFRHTCSVALHFSSGSPQWGPCSQSLKGSLIPLPFFFFFFCPASSPAPAALFKGAKSSLGLVRVAKAGKFFVLSFTPKKQLGQRHTACEGAESSQEMTRSWVWLELSEKQGWKSRKARYARSGAQDLVSGVAGVAKDCGLSETALVAQWRHMRRRAAPGP